VDGGDFDGEAAAWGGESFDFVGEELHDEGETGEGGLDMGIGFGDEGDIEGFVEGGFLVTGETDEFFEGHIIFLAPENAPDEVVSLAGDDVEGSDTEVEEDFFDDFDGGFLEGERSLGVEESLGGGVEVNVFDIEMDEEGAVVVEGAGDVEMVIEEPVQFFGRMKDRPGVGDAVALGDIGAGSGGQIVATAHELDEAFADTGTVRRATDRVGGGVANGVF
jgi:hypothetical protein